MSGDGERGSLLPRIRVYRSTGRWFGGKQLNGSLCQEAGWVPLGITIIKLHQVAPLVTHMPLWLVLCDVAVGEAAGEEGASWW